MAVATKSLLPLAVEFIDSYKRERAVTLDEINRFGTYKGHNVSALISTIYQYKDPSDHYQPKDLLDSLDYLSKGNAIENARQHLRHIQTTPEKTYEQPAPPEAPEKDVFDRLAENLNRKSNINASREVARDNQLAERADSPNITPEELAEIKSKRLSPAGRLIYGLKDSQYRVTKKINQLNQFNNQDDLLDQTMGIAQHHMQRELKIKGRELAREATEKIINPWAEKQLNKIFGPSIEYPTNISPGGVNITTPLSNLNRVINTGVNASSPISDLANIGSSATQNLTSNIMRNAGSRVASVAAQTAARAAAGVAAGVSAPVSGTVIIIAVVIIFLALCLYLIIFHPKEFAPYNPVKLSTDSSSVVAPPQGLLPPSSFTGDICPIPSKNITCTSFYDSRPGFDCHHCDAAYRSIDSTHEFDCASFPGTFYAIDVAAPAGSYIYLPTIAGDKIQWTLRGTEYIDQQIQKYTGVDEKTGAQYYLQLHHTLNGSGNPGTHESGEPGGRICTGSDCNHVHVQIGSGGSGPRDTIWLDASAYMCK